MGSGKEHTDMAYQLGIKGKNKRIIMRWTQAIPDNVGLFKNFQRCTIITMILRCLGGCLIWKRSTMFRLV
jgi:hypothetical protein